MTKNNFYVDNLTITDDNISELVHIYKTAIARLQEGNFSLRSCNSNSKQLKTMTIKDNSLVQHNSEFERILWYNYDPTKDLLNIATYSIDKGANTKRNKFLIHYHFMLLPQSNRN